MTELFQHRYYKINNYLLSSIGQWPYQSRTRRRTRLAIFLFLAVTQIASQIIAVVKGRDDPQIILDSISPFVNDIACGTKLANLVFNSDKMFKLAEHMKADWISVAGQPEINVLHEYAEIGRKFTIAYMIGIYVITGLFVTQPVIPHILRALKITDVYQPKTFAFPMDYYGIDVDSNYYYIFAYSYICIGAIVTVIVAADTLFIIYVQHACGMFTVVGRQLERLGNEVPENYEPQSKPSMDPDFQALARCIKKHSEVIEFANLLEGSYTWAFFSFIGFNMMMMSVTGFQTVMSLEDNPEETLRYALFTAAQMAHLFFQSFFAQRLMDHSQRVRNFIYQAKWYKISVGAQKLVNLVTLRTDRPCQITAGKVIVMSMENFTTVVKTSMSYFTLLRSTQ